MMTRHKLPCNSILKELEMFSLAIYLTIFIRMWHSYECRIQHPVPIPSPSEFLALSKTVGPVLLFHYFILYSWEYSNHFFDTLPACIIDISIHHCILHTAFKHTTAITNMSIYKPFLPDGPLILKQYHSHHIYSQAAIQAKIICILNNLLLPRNSVLSSS